MIKVFPAEKIGEDDRGHTHIFENPGRAGQTLLSFRRKGSSSGRHYHKGISPTKDPEMIVLVTGTMQINLRNVNTEEMATMEVEGPARLEIPPFIWHEVIALTDIYFVELNSLADGNNDTFM